VTEQPLVSIIIPTFNRAHLISETLDAIATQTYQNWECLVVDDGSTDGTKLLVNRYLKEDRRFIFLERSIDRVKGAPTCRNIGFEQAKGEYILFFDSDDILPPHVLKTRVQFALKNTGYDFYVFQTIRFFNDINNKDCIWNDLSKPNLNDLKSFLDLSPIWHTSGPLWQKSFLAHNMHFYTEGVSSWQDWEFHIRALLITTNYLKSDDETFAALQRFHKSETINKNNTIVATENRLELIFMVLDALHKHPSFKEKEVQLILFKLFYFVISKLPSSALIQESWLKIRNRLYLVPRIDFWFWRHLLYCREHNDKPFFYGLSRLFVLFKRIYFNKRFAIEDYSNRNWYTLKIKNL
jgi:glycosyltransferase involved in cell wall biosynthesis